MVRLFSVEDQVKGNVSVLIVGNIVCTVIKIAGGTVSYHIAGKSALYLGIIFNISVDDKRAVVWEESRKLMEGMTDILQVLEEIKMVFFYI